MAVEFFAEPVQAQGIALAPDGTRVAMLCLRHGDPHLALFAVDHPHLLTDIPLDTGRPGGLTWSPDGAALAFYADSTERYVSDVYVLHVDSGAVRNVTAVLRAHAHIPCWSPEGDRLAFAAYEPPVRADHPPHVFTVTLATGRIIQPTAGSMADFTPQFSPNGRTLAFRRAGDIWLLDLDRGVEHQVTHLGGAGLRHGCFAPDGARILVEYGPTDTRRVAVVDLATGTLHTLTPPIMDARSPSWSAMDAGIAFVADQAEVRIVSPDGSFRWRALLPDHGVMASLSLGPRWATRAEVLTMIDTNSNAWVAGPRVALRQVTFFPAPSAPHTPEPVTYPSGDGALVPALLYTPPNAGGSSGRAVIWAHGGPQAQEDPRNPYIQTLVSAGLPVLVPDYRGSSGHGATWEHLTPDESGVVDLADVVAGRDFLVTAGLANSGRVAVVGYSYGGYLALLALARYPECWAAGASLWGIVDARRSPPLRDEVLWRDDTWIAERSPAALMGRIRAPLLIVHAAHDTSSTVEEVQAAAAALSLQGTPCDLQIFWDDTHGPSRHTRECCDLLTSFLQRHLG